MSEIDGRDERAMGRWQLILRGETLPHIWRIPLFVGIFLSTINQAQHIRAGLSVPVVAAVVMNFLTPYVVSSLGYLTRVRQAEREAVMRASIPDDVAKVC